MGGAAYSDQVGNPAGCSGRKDNVLSDSTADNIGSCYFPATEYLGYFNPNSCYVYSSGQFNPGDPATSHACLSSTNGRWSGNFLNWASMTAIDEFIWAMTGGNRVTDTTTDTVVRRARSASSSLFPIKVISNASTSTLDYHINPSTVTPFSDTTLYIENSPPTTTSSGRVGAFKMNIGTTYASATSTTPDKGSFEIKVKLCATAANKEANCKAYTTTDATPATYYKPEGLLQKDANSKRFALTSYTADSAPGRQGGVLRSKMKYVGPQQPDGSGGMIANPVKEFGTDGRLIDNPDGATGSLNSGIINYINKFSDFGYKNLDPVSELFYESLRYFRNLGPTSENYSSISRSSSPIDTKTGGFWFYQDDEWDDPIQYSCQKNVILAINDAYPWLDKRLPGTAFTSQTIIKAGGGTYDLDDPIAFGLPPGTFKPTADWGSPSADAVIDVKSFTDQVGRWEDGRVYTSGGYTFNLNAFRVGGGNGIFDGQCTRKSISATGLGSVMATCPATANDTDAANRDNTYYIAGLAWYANTTDLRPGDSLPGAQTVTTYMIDTQEYNPNPNVGPTNPLWLAGKYGGFIDSSDASHLPDHNPNIDKTGAATNSEWDNNSDGEPDHYLLASDPLRLVSALNRAFSDIDKLVSSASATAANSTQLNTGTQVFQARFDSSDWWGELLAFSVDNGTPATATTPAIPAGALALNWTSTLPDFANRNIYTYNPLAASDSRGVPFQWANLTCPGPSSGTCLTANIQSGGSSQQDSLNKLADVNDGKGALRVNWLRGDASSVALGDFRVRTNFLGDIVNSDPLFVGAEDYGYGALPGIGSAYTSFLDYKTSRTPMIYAGANDGMLHGFNAKKVGGGQEIFAYIPNVLYPELSKLTSPGYTHQYYVDGTSASGDVHDGTNWHTVLVGTTGAGARALFGLDVTNPDDFTDPTKAASKVLWEFTSADPTYGADLGYTLAQPSVVKLKLNDKWAVIVGNGYDSDNGHAVLFVLDALTGDVLKAIDTGVGTTTDKNGLSSPIAVDTDNVRGVDTVYAGDLYGNLWKFDVSGSTGSWDVAYKSGTVNQPLFIACATTGSTCTPANRQPITAKPNVGKPGAAGSDQNGAGIMVYFGTGKYFETGDNIVGTGSQVQTFYGLWDQGSAITGRANLQEQTIDYEGFPPTNCVTSTTTPTCPTTTKQIRVVSKNPVCYAATSIGCTASSQLKSGWALNLRKPDGVARGERTVRFPLARRGLVVFSTVIPDPDPCTSGGTSFLMELDALSGGEFGRSPFDTNGNNAVDSNDLVIIDGVTHSASGIDLDVGITSTPTVVETTSVDFKYVSGTSGNVGIAVDYSTTPTSSGTGIRRSWRQLK